MQAHSCSCSPAFYGKWVGNMGHPTLPHGGYPPHFTSVHAGGTTSSNPRARKRTGPEPSAARAPTKVRAMALVGARPHPRLRPHPSATNPRARRNHHQAWGTKQGHDDAGPCPANRRTPRRPVDAECAGPSVQTRPDGVLGPVVTPPSYLSGRRASI